MSTKIKISFEDPENPGDLERRAQSQGRGHELAGLEAR